MRKNDYSLSSETLLDVSSPEDVQMDSVSFESSDLQEKPLTAPFKASTDLQHIIFNKLQQLSKQNLETGLVEQALQGYERCTEQLISILKGNTDSKVFQDYLYTTLNYLNDVALRYLRASNVNSAIKILEKCLQLSHPEPYQTHPDLQSLTYNHLGCCYRRIGDIDQALFFLNKALHFQEKAVASGIQGQYMESSSITHVNLCAVLSQSGQHEKALEHARQAVMDCTRDLIHSPKTKVNSQGPDSIKKRATMLAIAYFNMGVEADFCKEIDLAIDSYLKAYQVASEHIGQLDQVTLRFEQAFNEAKMKKRASHARALSPKKEGQIKRLWKPHLPRPQSAHQLKKMEPATPTLNIKLESHTSSHYLGKRLQVPSLGGIDSHSGTPSNMNHSAFPKMSKTPSASSGGFGAPKHTRKAIKPLTPSGGIKFFFPMGNMPPLVEPEKSAKEKDAQKQPQRPQRPATANPVGRGLQDHRTKKNTNTSSRWDGRSQGDDEILEDEQIKQGSAGTPVKPKMLDNFREFKEFLNPKSYNKGYYRNSKYKGNDSTKGTSMAGDPTEDPYASMKRVNKSSGMLGRSDDIEPPRREIKVIERRQTSNYLSRKYAVNTIQRHMRGWYTRRVLARTPKLHARTFWTGLSDTVNQDLEGKGKQKAYYLVMVYDIGEEMIYVEMKDWETRALYKGRIEYHLEKEELKQVCSKLRESIAIEDNKIVFKSPNGEEIKEDVMTEISERSDESDVGPLIEALEKEAQGRFLEQEPLEEIEEIVDMKVQIMGGSKESYEDTSKSSSILKFERSDGEKMLQKKPSTRSEDTGDYDTDKNKSIEKPSSEVGRVQRDVMNVKNFKINITNAGMGEESARKNPNVIFSKRAIIKGQVLTVKLETHQTSKGKQKLLVSVYDPRFPERFETIDLPSSFGGRKDLSLEDVLEMITVEFEPFRVNLNPTKQEGKPHDSFSSYNDASIALDISGPHTDKEVPAFHRSESMRKAVLTEDRKMLRGYSSGTIDSPLAMPERDHYQFLGLGIRKPRASGMTDDSGRFTAKVSEVSSGREHSRGIRDSRSTLSPRDGTQRSEAEGSIMLRVSEGIASHCRVAYQRGKSEILVKYAISQEEGAEYDEVKIGVDELGLDIADLEKDLVLEKVRGLLGKSLKYRQGKLVYEKKKSKDNNGKEEEKKIKLPTMPKIDELNEENGKKPKDSKRELRTEETPISRELKPGYDTKLTAEERKRSYGELRSSTRSKIDSKEDAGSIRSVAKLSRASSAAQSSVRSQAEGSLKEVIEENKSPLPETPQSRKALNFGEELTYVETFGAIQTEESALEKAMKKVDVVSPVGEDNYRPLVKKPSVEQEIVSKKTSQVSTPRMYESIHSRDMSSPKQTPERRSLRLPDTAKQGDSSPKVKSNTHGTLTKAQSQKEETGVNNMWASISLEDNLKVVPDDQAEEKKRSDARRKTLKRSNRSYAGDIPRIVIHKETESNTVVDPQPSSKAMSMGTLDNQQKNVEPVVPVIKKEEPRMSFSTAGETDEWALFKAQQRGEKLTARFNEIDTSKRQSFRQPIYARGSESPTSKEILENLKTGESKSKKYAPGKW